MFRISKISFFEVTELSQLSQTREMIRFEMFEDQKPNNFNPCVGEIIFRTTF